MDIDYEKAYKKYTARFVSTFGEKPVGSYVKFGKHMIQRLTPTDFEPRLNRYVELHSFCRKMLDRAVTVSDEIVYEFNEASSWVAVEPPDLVALFSGELGAIEEAAPLSGQIDIGAD